MKIISEGTIIDNIHVLEIFSDLTERLDYNFPGFPLYAKSGELRYYHQFTCPCHKHVDLEFAFILRGEMDYFVNGQIARLEQGDGIFINSNRLHYNYSKDSTNCVYLVVIIHPSLLGADTYLGKEFFNQRFGAGNEDFCVLKKETPWQNEALSLISAIHDELNAGESGHNLLRLISLATSLCAEISENIQATQKTDEATWSILWNMTGFIQKNYAEKINLDDIAAAGQVCRSRCCKFFNMYMEQTPNAYLTWYRVSKSCEMLRESGMSIIEIAMACGFQSSSYFTQIFKKETGITPKEYRKQQAKNP